MFDEIDGEINILWIDWIYCVSERREISVKSRQLYETLKREIFQCAKHVSFY